MRSPIPPLNALRTFDAAGQTGSFKHAARLLNVTPSAVSHQIKFLEDYLGVFLFVRSARGNALSPAGKAFHRHIHAAFREIEQGLGTLQRQSRPDDLTIQTYSTIAVRWLMPRIQDFQKRHPRLVIRLVTSQQDADFADDACDVALVIGRPAGARLRSSYVFTPRIFPVCTPQIAASLRSIDDLAHQTILQVYPSKDDWRAWLNHHGVSGVNPDDGLRFDSYDHALRMAARGHGVALAMQPYTDEDFAAGVLVRPFPDHDVRHGLGWHVVSAETRADTPHVRAFCKWVIGQVEADPALAPLREE